MGARLGDPTTIALAAALSCTLNTSPIMALTMVMHAGHVGRERAAQNEGVEESVRDVDDEGAPVEFGERCQEQRPNGVAEYEDGDHEGADGFRFGMILGEGEGCAGGTEGGRHGGECAAGSHEEHERPFLSPGPVSLGDVMDECLLGWAGRLTGGSLGRRRSPIPQGRYRDP
jgi:hypothetical protein